MRKTIDKHSRNYDGRGSGPRGFIGQIFKDTVNAYYFQFNPTSISMGEKANWDLYSLPGSLAPLAHFMQMSPDAISFELLLDATENTDRQKERNVDASGQYIGAYGELLGLLTILNPNIMYESFDVARTSRFRAPAYVIFGLGPIIKRCVFLDANWQITRWFSDLVPSRIMVKISLQPVMASLESDYNTLQSNIKNANTQKDMLHVLTGDKTYRAGDVFRNTFNQLVSEDLFLLE